LLELNQALRAFDDFDRPSGIVPGTRKEMVELEKDSLNKLLPCEFFPEVDLLSVFSAPSRTAPAMLGGVTTENAHKVAMNFCCSVSTESMRKNTNPITLITIPEFFQSRRSDFQSELGRICSFDLSWLRSELELERTMAVRVLDAAPFGRGGVVPTPVLMEPADQTRKMPVKQANDKAMKLARKIRAFFFALSERQQAEQIGCSWQTWVRTEFYRTAKAKRPTSKSSKPSSPKTESLTSRMEAVTGEGSKDEVLEQLIADQETDKEPSPLENDPPNRPRKVHTHKRL
jgi:hypothetical protein